MTQPFPENSRRAFLSQAMKLGAGSLLVGSAARAHAANPGGSGATTVAASAPLPESYRHWQDSARRLIEPLAALMQPGRADLEIAGAPSDHDHIGSAEKLDN